eukprot:COSAG02_NODE_21294_length_794_cov_1.256115_1_plen_153_part_01
MKKQRKSGQTSSNISDLLDDFSVADQDNKQNVVWLLLIDPLCPYIAVVTCFNITLSTIYNWQFLELMQIKLLEENPTYTSTDINNETAKYLGIISAGSVLLILSLQNVTNWLSAKYGTFVNSLNLPIASALLAVAFFQAESGETGKTQLSIAK